jgi:hypothetical protein
MCGVVLFMADLKLFIGSWYLLYRFAPILGFWLTTVL